MDNGFANRILGWYQVHKRDLPWRNTRDPYHIWLSEIILQQTRVSQGLPYYHRFIERFPDLEALANADISEVLRTWQGLGYYSRARNLHACANVLIKDHEGKFPESYNELVKLPGIGPYTAAAIASFAFDSRAAVLDGNVMRVLTRYFGLETDISSGKGQRLLREMALELLPDSHSDDYNQGIMEFGAIQCSPGKPDCTNCVLAIDCVARKEDRQLELPVKRQKAKVKEVQFTYFVLKQDGRIWMKERGRGVWHGLYDFLLIEEHLPDPEKWIRENISLSARITEPPVQKEHILSHRIINAHFFSVELPSEDISTQLLNAGKFFDLTQIEALPKPILIDWYIEQSST